MRKSAIVAGHICIDITPVFPESTRRVTEAGELLKPGKLIHTAAPDVHTGGAVANTGLAMKKLGADVRLMGKVGADSFGGMIRKILQEHRADGDLIVAEGETTSYSVVLAVPGIDRIFLHCPGANDSFDGSEISDRALEEPALFHFGYPTLMRKMYEDGGENLSGMFRRIKEAGIATSLDLAAVDPDSNAGKADWSQILELTLPYVDFFVPSFEELCFMLNRPRYERLLKESASGDVTERLSIEEDLLPLTERCLELGARAVLLKCGAQGLFLKTCDRMNEVGGRLGLDAAAWNGFSHFERSFRIERVLSGTGAGDTCIAAFLASILEGAGPQTAAENAAGAGALCCTAYDAISGLLTLAGIREKIDQGWEKRD